MKRAAFLIDGFNLYHSVCDALFDLPGSAMLWLDLHSLCSSYSHLIGDGDKIKVERILYFSAFAYHKRDNAKVQRHRQYIKALESTGVEFVEGRFKPRPKKCKACGIKYTKHEEKETDVAIGVTLFELFHRDECDVAVIVSGDTDLVPAIGAVSRNFPGKYVYILFPYKRKNTDLLKVAKGGFKISAKQYSRYQLPDPVILSDGTIVRKPSIY